MLLRWRVPKGESDRFLLRGEREEGIDGGEATLTFKFENELWNCSSKSSSRVRLSLRLLLRSTMFLMTSLLPTLRCVTVKIVGVDRLRWLLKERRLDR